MRDYGRIHSSFWTSPYFIKLSNQAKLLAAYFLTCEHSNIIGCFRLPKAYILEDLNWSNETLEDATKELLANGFVRVCEQSKMVWICKFLTWNKPENPNQWKAARKAVKQIPEQFQYKQEFTQLFSSKDPLNETLSKGLGKGFESVATETETETETEYSPRKFSDADFSFAELMFKKILDVAPKTKPPNLDEWADDIRLMRERDKVDPGEMALVFDWANRDKFWSTNILSPGKFRKQYPKLHAQMNRNKTPAKQFDDGVGHYI